MKTQEELNALKEEIEALEKKLAELSEEELMRVTGGNDLPPADGKLYLKCGTSGCTYENWAVKPSTIVGLSNRCPVCRCLIQACYNGMILL